MATERKPVGVYLGAQGESDVAFIAAARGISVKTARSTLCREGLAVLAEKEAKRTGKRRPVKEER